MLKDNIFDQKKAYETTIRDFEIAIRNTGILRFKERAYYSKMIKEYENKIDTLLIKSGQLDLD